MGRPLPGYRVALLDANGAPQQEGEICLVLEPRPTGLMQGYQADDGGVRTQRDPVYRTGDVAAIDDDGYLTYVGRADDVFKSSDYRISPFELESVLIEHPAVAEAAVVPSPDPMRLAVPKAFLALAPGHEPDRDTALSIFRHCRTSLAPFKRVRRLEFADLPKTISGKIRRVELRRAEAASQTRRQACAARILGRRLLRERIGLRKPRNWIVTALGKLLRTTAFKLTLVYLVIFVLFAASLLGYFALNTRRLITSRSPRPSTAKSTACPSNMSRAASGAW